MREAVAPPSSSAPVRSATRSSSARATGTPGVLGDAAACEAASAPCGCSTAPESWSPAAFTRKDTAIPSCTRAYGGITQKQARRLTTRAVSVRPKASSFAYKETPALAALDLVAVHDGAKDELAREHEPHGPRRLL